MEKRAVAMKNKKKRNPVRRFLIPNGSATIPP